MSRVYQFVKDKSHLTDRESQLHRLLFTSLDINDDTNCILMSFPSKEAVKIAKERHLRSVYDRFEMPVDDLAEAKLFDDIDIVVCKSELYSSCKSQRKVVLLNDDPKYILQYVSVYAFKQYQEDKSVRWSTGKACNYDCPGCIQSLCARKSKSGIKMLTDEAMIASAKIASQFERVVLIGGEPTIYNLPKILKYVDFSNIRIFSITTNGSTSYEYLSSILSMDKSIRCSFSFHTYHDGQEWLDKIKKLSDNFGKNAVRVNILPTKHNLSKLKSLNFYDLKLGVGLLRDIFYFNDTLMQRFVIDEEPALDAKKYFRNLGNSKGLSLGNSSDIYLEKYGYVGYGLHVKPLPLIENGVLRPSTCRFYKDGKCTSYVNCSMCLCIACGYDL